MSVRSDFSSAGCSMGSAGCMDSTWCTSFGQLSNPYSRASACCAAARFTAGSAARSAWRRALACLRSCSSDGRSGRCRRGGTDMTISFRISPASARRAERRSQIVTEPASGGLSPSRGRDASWHADQLYARFDGAANSAGCRQPGPAEPLQARLQVVGIQDGGARVVSSGAFLCVAQSPIPNPRPRSGG
jgi:hypothetical protein